MKAIVFRKHGGPEVLEYADVPEPTVGAEQVRVRVKACSVNHLDLWLRQGIPAYRIRLPHIPGSDVAGVVERVGEGVTTLRVGDRVVLTPGMCCGACEACRKDQDQWCSAYGIRGAATDGGDAELIVAEARDALPMPPGLSFEEAAASLLVFLTAWHMLVTRAKLVAGETVLVQAAGSGVGHAAVQIAKHCGARVFASVGSEAKVPKAEALGADAVISRQDEDVDARVRALTQQRGVDVVVEHVGPQTWDTSLKALANGGRLVTCGATTGPSVSLDVRYVFSRQLSILGAMMGTRAELARVLALIGERRLRPVVDTALPLREAPRAHERLAGRDVFGKLVLVP